MSVHCSSVKLSQSKILIFLVKSSQILDMKFLFPDLENGVHFSQKFSFEQISEKQPGSMTGRKNKNKTLFGISHILYVI